MEGATATETCYRHPRRETGVHCSNCGRPICPDCMTPTPVGMRCPECASQRTQVRAVRTMSSDPQLTYAIIAINVLVFVAQVATGAGGFDATSGSVFRNGALYGPSVADGEWYRIVTGGFLHANLIHVGFNMFILYRLGQALEPALGRGRFLLVYFVSLLGGSFGVLLIDPNQFTVGASGAVFGIMGAAVAVFRARGVNVMDSGLGTTILLNLALTFAVPGISIGGHVGGLVAGYVAGEMLMSIGPRFLKDPNVAVGSVVALGLLLAAGSILVA
jgi:membrane associated rhomboid family serine protease